MCKYAWIRSYRDDVRLTVNLVGLAMEVSPSTIHFFTVTMATLETPTRDSVAERCQNMWFCAWICFIPIPKQLEKNWAGASLLKRWNSFHFTVGGRTCELDIHCWAAVAAWHGPLGCTAGLWGTVCCWSPWSNNSPLLRRTAAAAPSHAWKWPNRETLELTATQPHCYNEWKYTHTYVCRTPLSAYSDQDASQWVQVSSRSSCQQHLGTGQIAVGNSKVQRSLPEVVIVLCNKIYI